MEETLPPHILKEIFRKITDPLKLLRLQIVSKDWKPLVDAALKQADWKALCENDFGHYALSTMIKSILPKTSFDDLNDITLQSKWMKIYYSYLTWCTCLNGDKPLRQFSTQGLMWNRFFAHDNNTITCLDAWSDYIAIGSEKGSIYLFTKLFLIKPSYIIRTGNKKIKKVKIWFTASDELFVVSIDIDRDVRFWNVTEKIERFTDIPKITNGFHLHTNTSRNLYIIKETQVLRLQLLSTCKTELKSSECDFNLAEQPCRILTFNFFEPHKISVLVRADSNFYLYSNVLDEPEGLNMSNCKQAYMPYMYIEPGEPFGEWPFFGFNNQSIMYLHIPVETRRNKGLVILNRFTYWHAIPMKNCFNGSITSITWHGHYFILGFEFGEIRLYYVKNLEHFEDARSIYNTQVRTIKLESNPVIDIKVSRISDMSVIIAITKSNIYKITLEK